MHAWGGDTARVAGVCHWRPRRPRLSKHAFGAPDQWRNRARFATWLRRRDPVRARAGKGDATAPSPVASSVSSLVASSLSSSASCGLGRTTWTTWATWARCTAGRCHCESRQCRLMTLTSPAAHVSAGIMAVTQGAGWPSSAVVLSPCITVVLSNIMPVASPVTVPSLCIIRLSSCIIPLLRP